MPHTFSLVLNPAFRARADACCADAARVAHVQAFHAGIPGYAPTPLTELPALAARLGTAKLWVKDESFRFGLNAFKALGGSCAIARCLCERFSLPFGRDTFAALQSPSLRETLHALTFVTATDGNHGRGVAWTAQQLGCRAIVYLPQGSAAERVENIRALGAQALVTELNYDDTVRCAAEAARANGWLLVQDTSWEGYEVIPTAVLQGYTTLSAEIADELQARHEAPPTHLFLQAGVGSMAAAVAGHLSDLWQDACPRIVIVEPDRADCLFRTASANDGALHAVTGHMDSMMAGLCCGEPCPIAWQILRQRTFAFISCSDDCAAEGMRLLAHPFGGDPAICSGESGAVTAGAAAALMTRPELAEYRAALGLGPDSRILVISTEGATDRENYLRIVGA